MRHRKLIGILASSFVSLVIFTSSALAEKITVSLKGMVCAFCAQGIKTHIGRLKGVERVEPDMERSEVRIYMQPQQTLEDEQIRLVIEDAGYEAGEIKRQE